MDIVAKPCWAHALDRFWHLAKTSTTQRVMSSMPWRIEIFASFGPDSLLLAVPSVGLPMVNSEIPKPVCCEPRTSSLRSPTPTALAIWLPKCSWVCAVGREMDLSGGADTVLLNSFASLGFWRCPSSADSAWHSCWKTMDPFSHSVCVFPTLALTEELLENLAEWTRRWVPFCWSPVAPWDAGWWHNISPPLTAAPHPEIEFPAPRLDEVMQKTPAGWPALTRSGVVASTCSQSGRSKQKELGVLLIPGPCLSSHASIFWILSSWSCGNIRGGCLTRPRGFCFLLICRNLPRTCSWDTLSSTRLISLGYWQPTLGDSQSSWRPSSVFDNPELLRVIQPPVPEKTDLETSPSSWLESASSSWRLCLLCCDPGWISWSESASSREMAVSSLTCLSALLPPFRLGQGP